MHRSRGPLRSAISIKSKIRYKSTCTKHLLISAYKLIKYLNNTIPWIFPTLLTLLKGIYCVKRKKGSATFANRVLRAASRVEAPRTQHRAMLERITAGRVQSPPSTEKPTHKQATRLKTKPKNVSIQYMYKLRYESFFCAQVTSPCWYIGVYGDIGGWWLRKLGH